MKHEKTKSTVEVSGLDKFRCFTTFTSLISGCVSMIIIFLNPRPCESNPDLRRAVIITASVQISLFFLVLLHYIHCGCLLRKLGRWLGIYYFILTGLMTWC